VDAGLVIISRFPIVASVFESYNLGILSDSASDKGYLYCKILINNHILHLFNTHLQASYNYHGSNHQLRKLTIMTRLHQMEILANRMEKILNKERTHPEGDLVIIAGDLNADARKIKN
jgi:endonuclease/exonuclease/phosphatase family metal-dependent hydrolase